MLEHGGRLRLAAEQWGIPLADWVDLSTGINPEAWPVPPLPADCWRRLPEENDGLESAAAAYYGNANLLALPGSQAAIQWLPALLPRAAVACLTPIYAEHPQAWERAGHKLRRLQGCYVSDEEVERLVHFWKYSARKDVPGAAPNPAAEALGIPEPTRPY